MAVHPASLPRVGPDELLSGAPRPLTPVPADQLAYLVFSSGSTGRPKAAMHRHGDLRTGIETYATQVLRLTPRDRCTSLARLFTSLGFGNGFFRVLGCGATAILRARQPGASEVPDMVRQAGVTVLSAVPTSSAQLATLASRRPLHAADLTGRRIAILLKEAETRFPNDSKVDIS